MPSQLPVGPYRVIQLADETTAPYYIIPFDKRGNCVGPLTLQHLLDIVKDDAYTDIFVFSHGWNNDWTVATGRYEDFLRGYMKMREDNNLAMPTNYKPLLIGIFWPSTALVFTEDEVGPDIATTDPSVMDELISQKQQVVRELADAIQSDDDTRDFYTLIQKDSLTEQEAMRLADIAKIFYQNEYDELQSDEPISSEEILRLWASADSAPTSFDDFGTVGGGSAAGPQAAGLGDLIKKLNPRNIWRTLTVYQMKDRAGAVGSHGVNSLLRQILEVCNSRVHMIGHSYGGKVVLSAVSFGDDLPRNVESMLLLQPAVSHLCFADTVPTTNRSGGYRPAIDRVNKPILTTFSTHDFPLTKTFHLALRRKDDLGEVSIAAVGEPPSKYAALGGYGPRKCNEKIVDIHDINDPYELGVDNPVIGLRSDRTIKGHGDISNSSTWWALYSLVTTED
jgi:pimeloyl-ACP methyl ester carboxylesterase